MTTLPVLRNPRFTPEATYNTFSFPINFYDRPELVISNILRGNYPASIRAIWQPDELSPEERKKLSQVYGEKDSFTASLINLATNPLVIFGAILAARYPIGKAGSLFKVADRAKGVASDLGPWTKHIGNFFRIFGKHPKLTDKTLKATNEIRWFNQKSLEDGLGKVWDRFIKRAGTGPTEMEQVLVSHLIRGSHVADGAVAKRVFPMIEKFGGPKLAGRTLLKTDAASLSRAGISRGRFAALEEAAEGTAKLYQDMFKPFVDTKTGKLRGELVKHLEAKGWYTGGMYHATSPMSTAVPHRIPGTAAGGAREWYAPEQAVGARSLANLSDEQMQKMLLEGNPMVAPMSGHFVARRGLALPEAEGMDLLRKAGLLDDTVDRGIMYLTETYSHRFQQKALGILQGDPGRVKNGLQELMTKEFRIAGDAAESIAADAARGVVEMGPQAAWEQFKIRTKLVGELPYYRTRWIDEFVRYTHSVSPVRAWNTVLKGEKDTLYRQVIDLSSEARMDGPRRMIFRQDYLPMLTGQKTLKQMRRQMGFNDIKLRYWETLQTPHVKEMFAKVPGGNKVHGWLTKQLGQTEGALSPAGINSKITAWFYYSTLGFNPAPALKNLMQPIITTTNVVGPGETWRAMGALLPKFKQYNKVFKAERKMGREIVRAHENAIKSVWPKYVEAGLDTSPMYADMLNLEKQFSSGVKKLVDKGKASSMALFTGTETFNRLLTWEAGLGKAMRDGLVGKEMYKFAGRLVRETQFPGGILGMSRATLGLPSPLRQFTHFPLRFADFLVGSTQYGGERGLNWGTIGRTMLTSSVAYAAGKELLNVDLSNALAFGALPQPPYEDAPFYPLPFVPPALSLAGQGLKMALTGDTSRATGMLAGAVPAGLMMNRFRKYVGPKHADYSQVQTTGLVSVFDNEGKMIGRYKPMELYLRTIGVPTMDQSIERDVTDYLIKQRDVISQYRREWLDALAANDMTRANEVQQMFQNKYPQLGPLRIKKSDIRAVRQRQEMTRVERILQQFPKEYQSMYMGMMSYPATDLTMQMMGQY